MNDNQTKTNKQKLGTVVSLAAVGAAASAAAWFGTAPAATSAPARIVLAPAAASAPIPAPTAPEIVKARPVVAPAATPVAPATPVRPPVVAQTAAVAPRPPVAAAVAPVAKAAVQATPAVAAPAPKPVNTGVGPNSPSQKVPAEPTVTVWFPTGLSCGQTGQAEATVDHLTIIPAKECVNGTYVGDSFNIPPGTPATPAQQQQITSMCCTSLRSTAPAAGQAVHAPVLPSAPAATSASLTATPATDPTVWFHADQADQPGHYCGQTSQATATADFPAGTPTYPTEAACLAAAGQ